MNKKEKAIIFNRADEYKRGRDGAVLGTRRHESYTRKRHAVIQVIVDLGLMYEYSKQQGE